MMNAMVKRVVTAYLSLALLLAPGASVLAEEKEDEMPPILTLEESLERAVRNSFQFRIAVERSEQAYIIREKAVEDWDEMDPIIPWLDYLTALDVTQKDLQWRMSSREIELLEDRIEYDVMRTYYDILREEAARDFAVLAVEHAKKGAARADIMHRVGALSGHELQKARSGLRDALNTLQVSEQELEKAYEGLNRMIGFALRERPLLVDVPEWNLLRDLGIGLYVARATDNNTAIWLAEQQVELARYDKKMHQQYDALDEMPVGVPGRGEPTEAKEKNVTIAQYQYYDTKRQIEINVRDIYRTVRMLEEEYDRTFNSLKDVERELRAMEVRLEAGQVTPYDLLDFQISWEQLVLQQQSMLFEHELLKYILRKPWVLSGSR